MYTCSLTGWSWHSGWWIGEPEFHFHLEHFLQEQLESRPDADSSPFFYIPARIYIYSSALATFYAPSDLCRTGGMHHECIHAVISWRGYKLQYDSIFVNIDERVPGMLGLYIAQVKLFFSVTINESTHQILSYGLLFLLFYNFPYTANPPTCTTPMQPSTTFTWSPPTIPYTHCTISPVPHQRPPIWPTDHVVIFSFLSLFSFTWCILLQPNQSQVIAPCGQDLTIHFSAHEPCAHFTYHLYLRLLYLLRKRRKFFPRTQT